jgi:hypothetical protein
MVTLLRRFLVLVAFAFWQGGFTFYAAVVVPIAQSQIGSLQGFITAEVTNYLNLAGAAALAVFAWDLAALKDRSRRRRWGLWISWAGMLVTLGVLVWLHQSLAGMLAPGGQSSSDPALFRSTHRWYLWMSTVQWGCGVAYAGLTLWAWQGGGGNGKPLTGASWGREPSKFTTSWPC